MNRAPHRRAYDEPAYRQTRTVELERAHGKPCPGCGEPMLGQAHDPTIDHRTPLVRGGTNEGPLRVVCRACNSRKGARPA